MVVAAELPGILGCHGGVGQMQAEAPLDGAPDPLLVRHLEHAGVGQRGDMAIERRGRNVGKFLAQLARRHRGAVEQNLDDAHAHGVEQDVRSRHAAIINPDNILNVEKGDSNG
ncbi:hypothetical protein MPSYJ_40990 [Mycolicibacterium psychrotolerans]|uniref:Uncharacterized protein n=1 Tax=Mycolicibacterium psychrotolerans TaxID=216929 RepID=A0A7I7MEM1_9MYCO|nr:hypothetical protein MPSYJ_40990 [Mycolicibacterium psychrotolerans]